LTRSRALGSSIGARDHARGHLTSQHTGCTRRLNATSASLELVLVDSSEARRPISDARARATLLVMSPTPETWRDQCAAALTIQEHHGTRKALGYLVGEKLLHHVEAAETSPEFARTLPQFVGVVRALFEPNVVREYLDSVKRVGAQGHVLDDDTFER